MLEVDAPSEELIMQDLVDTARVIESSFQGSGFPKLINASGKEDLGGGVKVGITVAMQNLLLAFQGRTTPAQTGTVSTNPGSTVLGLDVFTDASATFITNSIQRGSLVINFTDHSIAEVVSVDSETQLTTKTLVNGIGNTYDAADVYHVFNIVQVNASGGNLTAVDELQASIDPILPTAFTQVILTSSSSATLSEQQDIRFASYQNVVTLDVINGSSGTEFPVGTVREPANNLDDAKLIAAENGFDTISVKGDYTFAASDVLDGFTIRGQSAAKTRITLVDAASITNNIFELATISGYLDGGNDVLDCHLEGIEYIDGIVENSELSTTDPIILSGTKAEFIRCWSGVAGSDTPVLDLGGTGTELIIRDYTGGIKLINHTSGTDSTSIDMESGHVIFDSTITSGEYTVRGEGKVTDNSGPGATVNIEILDALTLNRAAFIDGGVYLVQGSGNSGTEFPAGTPNQAVDNLADAITIAGEQGLSKIFMTGFFTATATETLDGITVIGGSGASNVLILSGCTTASSGFERLIVTGALNGLSRLVNCVLGTTGLGGFTGIEGRVVDCIINNSAGVTQAAAGAGTLFDNCSFIAPNDPQIALDANGVSFSLRQCTGNILISNKTDSEPNQINMQGGRVEVDSSCTGGSFIVSGTCQVVDNSGGTTITEYQVSVDTIWEDDNSLRNTPNSAGDVLSNSGGGGGGSDEGRTYGPIQVK